MMNLDIAPINGARSQTEKEKILLRRWVKDVTSYDYYALCRLIGGLRPAKIQWTEDRLIVEYLGTGEMKHYFEVFAYLLSHDSAKLKKIFSVVRGLSVCGRNFIVLEVDGIYADGKRLIMAFGVNQVTTKDQNWDISFGLGSQLEHKF